MKVKFFNWVYKILGYTCIVLACGLIILRYVTPLLTPQVPQLSDWVASQLRYPTLIQDIKLNWDGLSPEVSLYNVEILTKNKKSSALHVQKIKLRLNVFQLLFKRLQVEELVLEGVVGGITYNHQSKSIAITKLEDLNFQLQNPGTNALLLNRLFIQNSAIEVKTDLGQNFALSQVNMLVETGSQIKVRAQAIVAGKKDAHIEFDADISLFKNIQRFYCHWQNGDLNTIAQLFPDIAYQIKHQDADIQLWGDIEDKQISLSSTLLLNDVQLKHASNDPLVFTKIEGPLFAKCNAQQCSIESKGFNIEQNNQKEMVRFALKRLNKSEHTDWHFLLWNFDLAQWQRRLQSLLPSLPSIDRSNVLSGHLDYAKIALSAKQDKFSVIDADIVFSKAGLDCARYPSFSNASGAITLNDKQGKAIIQSSALDINDKRYYDQQLSLNNLALVMNWETADEGLVFNVDNFHASVLNTPIKAQAKFHFQNNKSLPDVDLLFQLDQSSSATILALLPMNHMDKDLTTWLKSAINQGEHLGTTAVLRGNLSDFPFDNGEGTFEVYSEIDHMHFDYHPGWPAIEDLKASLHFRNRALFISAERGHLLDGQLIDADAVIPDLFTKMPELIVDTKLVSTLSQGMKVVAQSPLPQALIKTLDPLTFQGDMALSLGLEVPLSSQSTVPVKVRGLIEVSDASVALKESPHNITKLKGDVSFTQDSVTAQNLSGVLFDTPAQFSIESVITPLESEITLTAIGNIKVSKVQTLLNLPELKHVRGESDYAATLRISPQHTNQATLTLSSSLKGIMIDAPAPLAKTEEDINPIELKMYLEPNQLLRVAGKFGDNMSLAYSLGLRDQQWHSKGGHLHFGEKRVAKFREDQILLIDGNLPSVDYLQWKTFLTSSGLFASGDQATKLEPLIELDIGSFSLYGAEFENQRVEARWDAMLSQWNLLFDGQTLKGQIIVPKNDANAVVVDLQKVLLPKKLAQSDFTMSKVPSLQVIDIKIKEFTWGNKSFSDIQARLEPSWKGYFIPNVSAKLKDTEITLSGNWDYLATVSKISAQGKMTTKNISQTLSALGLKGTVQKAKGTLDFSLAWNGSPFDIDFASLGGLADFSLKEGTIVGMNPGIGRVLGLLNLDNVKRRLNLDFSDVTKKGFAFDELSGKFQFGKGKVSSNKVILNGPSAKIEAFGQADLANQGLDGEMVVMPNVTGSLPVAAAIAAGNPAVGAAVWVVDKLFGNKIQQIHRMRYKVLGTWASPKVDEVPVPFKG